MPRHKDEEEEIVEEVVETKSGSASVYTSKGSFVRTYTSEIHGKDYKKLAEMYAGKISGSIK